MYSYVENKPSQRVDPIGLVKYAKARCSILYVRPDSCDCMWKCECPRGYMLGSVRSQFPASCDEEPYRTCFKPEGSDYVVLGAAAVLVLIDGPFPIGDWFGGALLGGRFAPLLRPLPVIP